MTRRQCASDAGVDGHVARLFCALLFMVGLLATPCAAAVPADRIARLARGINISEVLQGSATYGHDLTRIDQILASFAEAGFTYVRLPIGSGLFVAGSDEYTQPVPVTQALYTGSMEELHRIVAMILAHGLAVTIDMHQDSNSFVQALHCDKVTPCATAERQLEDFWKQAARDLVSTDPDRVFLELLNEPNMGATEWDMLSKRLIGIVRAELPHHTLIVGAVEWYSAERLEELKPYSDGNLVYTFHFYSPMEFTHQGAVWNPMVAGLKGIRFPTVLQRKTLWPPFVQTEIWDAARIASLFRRIGNWQQHNGVPVIINEFGAIANGPLQDRVCWIYAVRYAAETTGIGWAYWDYFYPEAFGLAVHPGGWPPMLNPELAAALGLKNAPSHPLEDCR